MPAKQFVARWMLVTFCLTASVSAQTISHEEEVVRSTYAALSFLCGLPPVTDAAIEQRQDRFVGQAQLERDVALATPVFELSNFRTGDLASISGEKWRDYIAVPAGQVLYTSKRQKYFNDNGRNHEWSEEQAQWKNAPEISADEAEKMLQKSVGEIALMGRETFTVPAIYTRYAAFHVSLAYQGKTVSYKAIFFFGRDGAGREVVAPQDLIGGGQGIWDALDQSAHPAGLLQSKLRDTPAVDHWVQASRMQDEVCSARRADLCCAGGRCGLREAAVRRDLARPLPEPPAR